MTKSASSTPATWLFVVDVSPGALGSLAEPPLAPVLGPAALPALGAVCGALGVAAPDEGAGLLGVEAWVSWLSRFLDPARAIHEPAVVHWLRSAHYVVDVCVFATTVVFALEAHRGVVVRLPKVALFGQKLEGAA